MHESGRHQKAHEASPIFYLLKTWLLLLVKAKHWVKLHTNIHILYNLNIHVSAEWWVILLSGGFWYMVVGFGWMLVQTQKVQQSICFRFYIELMEGCHQNHCHHCCPYDSHHNHQSHQHLHSKFCCNGNWSQNLSCDVSNMMLTWTVLFAQRKSQRTDLQWKCTSLCIFSYLFFFKCYHYVLSSL